MAVTNEDLIIAIEAQTKEASKGIADLTKNLEKMNSTLDKSSESSEKTTKSVTDSGASFVKMAGFIEVAKLAYESLKVAIEKTTGSYLEQIDSEKRLGMALASTGKFTEQALNRFKDFANQMQKTTTLGDDQVLNMSAQAAAMGLTEEQIKKLITASAGLAAVNGKDVGATYNALLKTYKGIGGATELYDKQVGELTQSQLMHGKAVDMMAEKYGKFATSEGDTAAGQAKMLKNGFGDLLETIGEMILRIVDFDGSTQFLRDTLSSLQDTIMENKDEIVAYGKAFLSVLEDVGHVVVGLGAIITQMTTVTLERFMTLFKGVQFGLNAIGVVSDEALQKTRDRIESLNKLSQKTATFAMNQFKAVGNVDDSSFEKFSGKVGVATDNAKKLQDQFKGVGNTIDMLSDNGKKSLEDLTKFVADLGLKVAGIGLGRADALEAQKNAQLAQLKIIEDKVKKEGAYTAEARKQITAAREMLSVEKERSLAEDRRKILIGMRAENDGLQDQLNEYGKTQQEILDNQLMSQMRIIKLKEDELNREGLMTDALQEQLDKQRELIGLKNKDDKASAPSKEYEAPLKAGQEAAKSITNAFAPMMGFIDGVNAVTSAVSAILDAIPKMLDGITSMINKLTDLPNVLLAAVDNLLGAISRFITDFAKNLANFISGFIKSVVEFIEKLPDMIIGLLDSLPDLIDGILSKLPEMAERLVTALIVLMPKIAIAFAMFLIKEGPKIAIAMIKVFYIELPKAIIKGIIEGAKQLVGMFADMFKGIGPSIKFDPKKIGADMKKMMDGLTGQSSQLFQVADLSKALKGKSIMQDLLDAGRKSSNWILDAWKWVLARLKDVFNFIKELWSSIYDAVLKPFIEGLSAVWNIVYEQVLKPFLGYLKAGWDGIVNVLKITFDAITQQFKGLWSWVKGIWDTMMGVFTGKISLFQAAADLWKNTGKFISDSFTNFVDYFKKVGESVANTFTASWDSLKNVASGLGNIFTNLGTKIWEGLNAGLQSIGSIIGDQLNKLNPANLFEKIFKMDDKGQGTVEKALGINVPFANFAQGGYVPGRAQVPGDSLANDRIMALLSPDEAIIPRSITQNPKLKKYVDALLDGSIEKKFPAFWGGAVGQVITATQGAGGAIGEAVGGVINTGAGALGGVIKGVSDFAANPDSELNKQIGRARAALSYLDPREIWKQVQREAMQVVTRSFEANKFHNGGLVDGETRSTLLNGEFVMNRQAVNNIGVPSLTAANNGRGMGGGDVNNYNVNLNVTVENHGNMDENFVRQKMYPIISSQLKTDSLSGKLVISKRGIY